MTSWASYLARGIPKQPKDKVIYHMCIRKDFEDQISNNGLYFSPTFSQEQFIHATANPSLLLPIGNHFYKNDINEWICLEIDVNKLVSPVKYEPGLFLSLFLYFDLTKCLFFSINDQLIIILMIYFFSCSSWFNTSKTTRF